MTHTPEIKTWLPNLNITEIKYNRKKYFVYKTYIYYYSKYFFLLIIFSCIWLMSYLINYNHKIWTTTTSCPPKLNQGYCWIYYVLKPYNFPGIYRKIANYLEFKNQNIISFEFCVFVSKKIFKLVCLKVWCSNIFFNFFRATRFSYTLSKIRSYSVCYTCKRWLAKIASVMSQTKL